MHCSACEKEIIDDDVGITCCISACSKSYHISCTDLTQSEISSLVNARFFWACTLCQLSSDNVLGIQKNVILQSKSTGNRSELKISTDNSATRIEKLGEYIEAAVPAIISQTSLNLSFCKINTQKITDIENRIEKLEEHQKRCNIEINGIPYRPNEDLNSLVNTTLSLLNCEQDSLHITEIKRIRSYSDSPSKPIIISFSNYHKKELVLSRAKRSDLLLLSNLGFSSTRRFYLNEHLTANKKKLLYLVKQNKNQIGYSRLWVKKGNILIKIKGATINVTDLDTFGSLSEFNQVL